MARTTIPAELVAINAIQGTLIADNAITAVHIATNAVSGTLVADNAITSTHIAQNNVTATQIAQNTITVTQIADSAVETAKINNDAVTQAKIADDAVGPDQLAANAVVSASIANGTIVEADMADNAVTLAKMASLARGSIIYGDSAGDPAALSIGSNGTVLKSDGTDVSWGTVSGGSVAGISSSADATAITIDSSERVLIGASGGISYAHGDADDVVIYQSDGNVGMTIASATDHSGNIWFSDGTSGADQYRGWMLYNHGENRLSFGSNGSERMRIHSTGHVSIGGTTNASGDGLSKLTVGSGSGDSGISIYSGTSSVGRFMFADGTSGSAQYNGFIDFTHSDSSLGMGVNGGRMLTILSSGNVGIGTNSPASNLHVETNTHANIRIQAGASSSASLRLRNDAHDWDVNCQTNDNFAIYSHTSSAERLVITTGGNVLIRTASTIYDGGQLQLTSPNDMYSMYVSNTGFASHGTMLAVERAGTSSYSFAQYYSGRRPDNGGGDREFNFKGDGNAYADASWNASGADYAEYFEWADGNTDNNDRVGHSVSLVNNKIKIAESGETVIGIISGNPSVVGDTASEKWTNKYLKDDYERYIWEEYTEEDGKTVDDKGNKLTRRKLNPDYNSETAYINRENRKEWDAVGLMGKLRMKKGQQTGTNWIKMRDISASVEEWLVR